MCACFFFVWGGIGSFHDGDDHGGDDGGDDDEFFVCLGCFDG